MNPMHGRNRRGITATANSLCKVDFTKYQGGSLQIELNPAGRAENMPEIVDQFARSFFEMKGVQVNLNIVDLKELERAMDDPRTPNTGPRRQVTGYSAHFVALDRKLQKEFIARVNYESI